MMRANDTTYTHCTMLVLYRGHLKFSEHQMMATHLHTGVDVFAKQSLLADQCTLTSLHGLSSKTLAFVLKTRTKRALISLSALQRLMSSTSSLIIDTPSTKIKGANVVAGLCSSQVQQLVVMLHAVFPQINSVD